MTKIGINSDKYLTVWSYSDNQVYDLKSACKWVEHVSKHPDLKADYITLRDLTNRNDEGNTSVQISGSEISFGIYHKAQNVGVDIISLTGEYKGKLIVTGVDLRDKTIFITLKNNCATLSDELQEVLGLAE